MADGKKSFTAYCDWGEMFDEMTDEQLGKLTRHLWDYVRDKNPKTEDLLTKISFAPIKSTLKRDLKKWESKKQDRSRAGILGNLKRYQKDLYALVVSEEMDIEEAQEVAKGRIAIQGDTKLAVKDSVSVSVSDSVKDKVSPDGDEKKIKVIDPDVYYPIEKCKQMYQQDRKVVNAVCGNTANRITVNEIEKRLEQFNSHLTELGQHAKSQQDYNAHFLAWHKKNKKANSSTKKTYL